MASVSLSPEVVSTALGLAPADRMALIDVLHASLSDSAGEHGQFEDPSEVASAWSAEIGRRVQQIRSGEVKTIPADEAEALIRGDG